MHKTQRQQIITKEKLYICSYRDKSAVMTKKMEMSGWKNYVIDATINGVTCAQDNRTIGSNVIQMKL